MGINRRLGRGAVRRLDRVSLLPQTSIARQIVLQAFSRSVELNPVMIPTSWGTSLARYLVDLTEDVETLTARGVSPLYVGNQAVGVPLPFTPDWFLAVLVWPDSRELALEFLIHAAAGGLPTEPTGDEGPSTPQMTLATLSRQKIDAKDHNPVLDGAAWGAPRGRPASPAARCPPQPPRRSPAHTTVDRRQPTPIDRASVYRQNGRRRTCSYTGSGGEV